MRSFVSLVALLGIFEVASSQPVDVVEFYPSNHLPFTSVSDFIVSM